MKHPHLSPSLFPLSHRSWSALVPSYASKEKIFTTHAFTFTTKISCELMSFMGTSTFVETGAVLTNPKFSGVPAESNVGTVGESKGFAGDSA